MLESAEGVDGDVISGFDPIAQPGADPLGPQQRRLIAGEIDQEGVAAATDHTEGQPGRDHRCADPTLDRPTADQRHDFLRSFSTGKSIGGPGPQARVDRVKDPRAGV